MTTHSQIPYIELREPASRDMVEPPLTPSPPRLSPDITGDDPLSVSPPLRGRELSYTRSRQPSRSSRPPDLKILIAPSGFKEAIGPEEVASAIEEGLRRVVVEDTATIAKLPLHDGGEGFCKALVGAHGGEIKTLHVTGPIGEPVESYYGLIGDNGAVGVLDMAAAAGLRLVPQTHRDPTKTTTFGVGQLMNAALDQGCKKIIIGCGDSGTSDGGAGLLQALGACLLDKNGKELPCAGGGATLVELGSISMDTIHPRLRPDTKDPVTIQAVCNVKNVLCGEYGVARVYGPQKGATNDQVETLSSALERLASVFQPILGRDISLEPGSGASGGLGAALLFLGAQLRPRSEAINEYFHIDDVLSQRWDFVFTAEGSLDHQSTKGKMTVEVARRAHDIGAQVIVLAGTIGHGADLVYEEGVEAFASILNGPLSLAEAIATTDNLLKDAAERSMRMIQTGMAVVSERDESPLKFAVSRSSTF
ncbi:unnamed protein product [Discula destructiva]